MIPSLNDLKLINTKINMCPYKSDPERYGMPEFWEEIDARGGDCDDYAVAKMQELKRRGVPIQWLRLATCWVDAQHTMYHCVLLVDLGGQTWVLDNRYPLPMEFQMLPYKWDKLQIAGTRNWEVA